MKIGKPKPPGIAGYTPVRKVGDPTPPGHPWKRPSLYRDEYCQSLVEYFQSKESWFINYDLKNSGKVLPQHKLPTFERYAAELGVSMKTLANWVKAHEDFAEAYEICKDIQKAFLLELGAAGVGNHVTALMLRTNHGMKDAPEDKDDDKPLEIRIVKAVKPGTE